MKESLPIPILFFEYEGAAQATGLSIPALVDLVNSGEIPHLVRPDDRVIFPVVGLMEWLSVQREGVAFALSLSVDVIDKLVEQNKIPHAREGNRVVFEPKTLVKWLSELEAEQSGERRKRARARKRT